MTTQAYFLVAHGSRSPKANQNLQILADHFQALLGGVSQPVCTGFLEFQSISLAEQIIQFRSSLPWACREVHVLPIFLLPGNHVRLDIPTEMQRAQAKLTQTHPGTSLILNPHLGSHPVLKQILSKTMASLSASTPGEVVSSTERAWILLGHGSRRPAGNHAIAQLAHSLQACPAYWAVAPSLSDCIQDLSREGFRSIGIIPYFLFSGKITDAIADQVHQLSRRHPSLALTLLSPFEPSHALAAALLDLAQHPIALSKAVCAGSPT